MSTRANITFRDKDDRLYTVPVPWDGYPSGIGPQLVDALRKTDCRSIRNNKAFLAFASRFVLEEPGIDYKYEVDVSRKEFKIAVYHGLEEEEQIFKGSLDEFAVWMKKQ